MYEYEKDVSALRTPSHYGESYLSRRKAHIYFLLDKPSQRTILDALALRTLVIRARRIFSSSG